MLGKQFG
jgi:hypothetical protein